MLLAEEGVVVHPGAFYGIAEGGRVVVSLIGPLEEFSAGMQKIRGFRDRNQLSN
jgi:alanine-synthesizing transaminase